MGMSKLGFIGLGLMGGPMAANLARAGFPLTVYNRSSEKAELHRSLGATVASGPRQVAEASQVIITMLSDALAVEGVLTGDDGALAAGSDRVLIDMSTVAPGDSRRLAGILNARGWQMLDAPVFGSTGPAEQGTLGIMVGGDPDLYQAQRPVFEALGRHIFYMGAQGAGSAVKLAFNLLVASQLTSLAEAMVFAARSGISPAAAGEVIAASGVASDLITRKIRNIVEADFAPAFPLKHMHKDLGLMIATGHETQASLPTTACVHQLFSAAQARGYGDQDSIAVFRLLAELSGL
jgi:3-hydroxyisobutyrate dehydrogenase-like beta-hydroxyacid dehydrogenase